MPLLITKSLVYWNYQASKCGQRSPSDYEQTKKYSLGSTLLSSYNPSDFTLVKLHKAPPESWNIKYSGWDARVSKSPSSVAIHHPSTDYKSISFSYAPVSYSSYLDRGGSDVMDHVKVSWDKGTTEPGSSGSPLFDHNHRVIGQLHGGGAACGVDEPDWYGSINTSWTGGGTKESRLMDWLDPSNSGQMFTDTL